MTAFALIGNNGFTTEDHPQPELWAEVLAAAGLTQFEYFADHLEPVIFRAVVEGESEFFQATRAAIRLHGLTVFSGATARISYLLNLLSHPYPDMRASGRAWLRAFIDLTRKLGGRFISGHYDCISLPEVAQDLAGAVDRLVGELVEVSAYAREAGLEGIFLEVMHRPQLQPYTIAGARELIDRLNHLAALPFHIHIDTGHMAFVEGPASAGLPAPAAGAGAGRERGRPTASPEDRRFADHQPADRDVYRWLATAFGRNEWLLVHAQQTDARASRHWPFTARYNRRGIIDARRVIQAIAGSGVSRAVIALEVLYPRAMPLARIRPDIIASARYWREAFVSLGYQLRSGWYVQEEKTERG